MNTIAKPTLGVATRARSSQGRLRVAAAAAVQTSMCAFGKKTIFIVCADGVCVCVYVLVLVCLYSDAFGSTCIIIMCARYALVGSDTD